MSKKREKGEICMKRKLLWTAIAFAAGIYAGAQLSLPLCLAGAGVLLLAVLVCQFVTRRTRSAVVAGLLAVSFFAGAVAFSWADEASRRPLYPYLTKTVDFAGTILSRPEIGEYRCSYDMTMEAVSYDGEAIPVRESVRLSVPYEEGDALLGYGDVIRGTGEIALPMESLNEGGFDYAVYLKSRGVFFTCNAIGISLEKVGTKTFTPVDYLALLRFHFLDVIDAQLVGEEAALMRGILLGDKETMSDAMQEHFKNSGLSHIVAVSGMHVGYLVMLLFLLTELLHVRRRTASIIAAAALAVYVGLVGVTPSVIRATILGLIVIGGNLLYRPPDTLTSLGAAGLLILVPNPLAAFDAGFMLSFSAALGITVFSDHVQGWLGALLDRTRIGRWRAVRSVVSVLCVTISAQLFSFPVMVYLFGTVSVWSLVTNLLVTPIIPILMAAGMLLCYLGSLWDVLALPVAGFCYVLLRYVNGVASLFGGASAGVWAVGEMSPFLLLGYGLLLGTCYCVITRKKRFVTLCCAAPLAALCILGLLVTIGPIRPLGVYDAQVCFINVGQGDCSYIQLGDTDILVDAGGRITDSEENNIGAKTVVPYMRKKGVDAVDIALVSHYHADHAQGMLGVMDTMEVGKLVLPFTYADSALKDQLLAKAAEEDIPVVYFMAGDTLQFSADAEMEMLSPDPEWLKGQTNQNNNSLVARLDCGETSFLYMGDLESDGEAYLLDTRADALDADVLKVGHHGSRTSSSAAFLAAVTPDYAVICCGEDNSYGHPHQEVLDRLDEVHARVLRTDLQKDITFYLRDGVLSDLRTGNPGGA